MSIITPENNQLISKLQRVVEIGEMSKWARLMVSPFKYLVAICHRILIYKFSKKPFVTSTQTFFDAKMYIALPAGTDIYLTGGKSHPSETKLAHFMINTLSPGEYFLDIGAHFGYFTLLASHLIGTKGKVKSIEPSKNSYAILTQNTQGLKDKVETVHCALAAENEMMTFYEFPSLYSEYNALDVSQYKGEKWYGDIKRIDIQAYSLDHITEDFVPHMIKIDVEGGEYAVIKGGARLLKNHAPVVIMEYIYKQENQLQQYPETSKLLFEMGYNAYAIRSNGMLQSIENIEQHMKQHHLESENIVFKKKV
jgi:FkbM family methyltransferase